MNEEFLNSPHVTWAAKGLLLWLAERQGEPTRLQDIIDASPSSRDRVLNILTELETAGYLRRVQDTVAGRYQPLRYEVNLAPDATAFTQYVYLVKGEGMYKIGMSRTPKSRIRAVGNSIGAPVETLHIIDTDDMISLERYLHFRYNYQRIDGEWFDLNDEQVAWIKALRSVSVNSLVEKHGADVLIENDHLYTYYYNQVGMRALIKEYGHE